MPMGMQFIEEIFFYDIIYSKCEGCIEYTV